MVYLGILAVILVHWFADFVLQTHEEATNKSTSLKWLVSHTSKYSIVWSYAMIIYTFPMWLWNEGNPNTIPYFLTFMIGLPLITFILHTLTDYYTSKLTSRLWKEGRVHDFFVAVGFDQVLHYIQLFGTFYLLNLLWT